jgi:hypothetical protein
VADLWLDGTAAFATLLLSSGQPPGTAPRDVNGGESFVVVAAIAFVDEGIRYAHASNPLERSDRLRQRVSVVEIGSTQVHTDNPVATVRRRGRNLYPTS